MDQLWPEERRPTSMGERGLGYLEILIALSIFAIVIMGTLGLDLAISHEQRQVAATEQLDLFRRNLIALILSDGSWQVTLSKNPSLTACFLTTPASCVDSQGNLKNENFDLYDSGNNLYYKASDPTNGVTIDGQKCGPDSSNPHGPAYNPAGSEGCPFRFDLRWTPVCTTAAGCSPTQVKVSAVLFYNPVRTSSTNSKGSSGGSSSTELILNTAKYSVPDLFRKSP